MRRIRYAVAMSLDGFIAGPHGEADWIIMDPEIDFSALFDQFDAMLIGRKTYEATLTLGGGSGMPGMETYVISRTLRPQDAKGVTVVADDIRDIIAALKERPGKDIWLMGGGSLFRSLLGMRLVDTVEIAVVPVLLGAGIPMLPPPMDKVPLRLTGQRVYQATGTVSLEYAVAA